MIIHYFLLAQKVLNIFLETFATLRLQKLSMFLRNYRDCKAVALKEYYDYSPISTCTERATIFLRNDSDCKDVDLYNTKKSTQ